MAISRHESLEELFSAALEIHAPADRQKFLREACGANKALRVHVAELLAAHDRLGDFLDVPAVDPQETSDFHVSTPVIGTVIGRYRILQKLGEGGFGFVYMAEQTEPVRRPVALKIIKLGMDTREVIARFEAERQALALMDHPNICRVFDAGATDAGRPYFVMELVKGVSINEYCDRNRLTTRERLELFVPVCHAVQHAHQKGIIHRDLKPSNVLVTLQEGQPTPKVIDFGIAKATGQRLTDKTVVTEFRQFIGTPEYMSPDQADVQGSDIDTRSDIYSLGVLMYELMTSRTPIDAQQLKNVSLEDVLRTIREAEPIKPSARWLSSSATKVNEALAKCHQAEPRALSRTIRGDLDWIVMKALEKDRARRYVTCKDLADDIQRQLNHQPVSASPPGVAYRFRKFVRRHRAGVLAGAMILAAVLTGLGLAIGGYIQANRARAALKIERDAAEEAGARESQERSRAEGLAAEAQREAAKSATANQFLQEMLASVDPGQVLGREVTVSYMLDEAAQKIDEGTLSDQPEVEAAVRMTLGETYLALGLYPAAAHHLQAALTVRSRLLGEDHPDALRACRAVAELRRIQGDLNQAESLLRRTVETQQRVLGGEHPDTLATMNQLGLALSGLGRFAEAEAIHRQTLDVQRRVRGEADPRTVASMLHLGDALRALEKLVEAEAHLRQALELSRQLQGEEHPSTTEAMNNLGMLLEDQHHYDQAEQLYRQTYEAEKRILGAGHPHTLIRMNNLLRVLNIQGKVAEIGPLMAERLARLRRQAEEPDATPLAQHAYAWELLHCPSEELRDPAAALPCARRAVELDEGKDPNFLDTLAFASYATGDLEGAINTQRQAVAQARLRKSFSRAEFEAKLVDYLLEKGDVVSAAAVSWEGLATQLGESLIPGTNPGGSLVAQSDALMREGRFGEAAALLRGCLAMRQKVLPEGHWLLADTTSRIGAALAGEGRFAQAESALLEAYQSMQGDRRVPADSRRETVARLARLYDAWDKPDRAQLWKGRLRDDAAEETAAD